MDKDGNGSIDLEEFLATAKAGDDQTQLEMMFHFMDGQQTSDGKITLDEWIAGMGELNNSEEDFNREMDSVMQVHLF